MKQTLHQGLRFTSTFTYKRTMCFLTGDASSPRSPARARFLPDFADELQRERHYIMTWHHQHVFTCLMEARHGCFLVTGAPRVGKTTSARRLAAHVQSNRDRNVMCVAPILPALPTNSTQPVLFNTICLSTSGTEREESNVRPMTSSSPSFESILSSDVFIMDNVNILTKDSLDLFCCNIQQACELAGMNNKVLIFIGDMNDLPTCCIHNNIESRLCSQCHLSKSLMWSHASLFILNHHSMHRQLSGHDNPIFRYYDDFIKIQHVIQLLEQVAVFNSMCWRHQGLFVITGEPCGGKCTIATQLAVHHVATCKKVLCLGSTPITTGDLSVNACSIRAAFLLPTQVCFRTIPLSHSDSRVMNIVLADVIIIHARPMISCHMLD
jgi:hypothetical protein